MRRTKSRLSTEGRGRAALRFIEKEPRFRRARESAALITAIQFGDTSLALWFLKQGFDPNHSDAKGRTALWWAAAWKRGEIIRALVNRGAPLVDNVLMGPVKDGDVETVRFLIRRGANVNCVSADYSPVGRWNICKNFLLTTAIGTAGLDRSRESIPMMLIRAGAKVNRLMLVRPVPGLEDRSLLGLAASYGLRKTVRAMLTAGAKPNLLDSRGRTALFDAVLAGHVEIAKDLLRAGARRDVRDHSGRTALQCLDDQTQSPAIVLTEILTGAGLEIPQSRRDKEKKEWRRQRSSLRKLLE